MEAAAGSSRRRSVAWRFFKPINPRLVQCLLCTDLQSIPQGSTTPMLRHLRFKHPEKLATNFRERASEAVHDDGDDPQEEDTDLSVGTHSGEVCPQLRAVTEVDLALEEDGDPEMHMTMNGSDISSAVTDVQEAAEGDPAGQAHEEATDGGVNHPVRSSRRSLVWRHFECLDSLNAVRCLVCRKKLQCFKNTGTSNLRRHMLTKHRVMFDQLVADGLKYGSKANGDTWTEQREHSVTGPEDGDPEMHMTMNGSDFSSAVTDVQEAAEGDPAGQAHEEATDGGVNHPVTSSRRSLVWRHFVRLSSLKAARCLVCMKKLQCCETGGTSNLRRHMLKKHPVMFDRLVADGLKCGSKANGDTCTKQRQHSVTGPEDGDPEMHMTMNGSDISSAVTDVQEAAEGDPAGQAHGEATDGGVNHPVRSSRRSLVWRHFERLDSLNAARCLVCMKKLQCCETGTTSNLRRHMLKRHPEMFARLMAEGLKCGSKANGNTSTEQRQHSGELRERAFAGQKQLLRRERELIEALRRTQKEEAQALEHQRQLLEKLRAADAREVAEEWKKIDTLRKAQQEEAEELSRQREELQRERTELQKEREELLLFSTGQ